MSMTSVLFQMLYFSIVLIICQPFHFFLSFSFFPYVACIFHIWMSNYENDDNEGDVTSTSVYIRNRPNSNERSVWTCVCVALWVYFGLRRHQNKGCTDRRYLPWSFAGRCLVYVCVCFCMFSLFPSVFKWIFIESLLDLSFLVSLFQPSVP